MLNLLIGEYLAICKFLEESQCSKRKGYFMVRREVMEALLSKNAFETAEQKLRYWKQLGWIDAEPKRCTRRIYDGETRKYYPYVMIDIGRYCCIRDLKEIRIREMASGRQ